MQPDEGDTQPDSMVEMSDFTAPGDDPDGSGHEIWVGAEDPDHDPFADYPDGVSAEEVTPDYVPALVSVMRAAPAKLAHNLDVRRQKIWACWGHDVVVGWIGNGAHQAGCSDHNTDSVGMVHAIDPMVRGTRAKAVVNACLAHSGDLQYVIHNRVIWSRSKAWKPKKYTGSNPHTDHVHVSGKHGTAHRDGNTCTGYDLAAERATPIFDLCPKPTSPKPPAKPPAKPTKPKPTPTAHAPGTRSLRNANPAMSGADVAFVQTFIGTRRAGKVDGKFGDKTEAGVRWYQKMRGIRVDGIVGPATWRQMGVRWRG